MQGCIKRIVDVIDLDGNGVLDEQEFMQVGTVARHLNWLTELGSVVHILVPTILYH